MRYEIETLIHQILENYGEQDSLMVVYSRPAGSGGELERMLERYRAHHLQTFGQNTNVYVIPGPYDEILGIKNDIEERGIAGCYQRIIPRHEAIKEDDEINSALFEDIIEKISGMAQSSAIDEESKPNKICYYYTADEILSIIKQTALANVSDWHFIGGKEIKIRNQSGNMMSLETGKIVREEELIDVLREMTIGNGLVTHIEQLYTKTEEGLRLPSFSQKLPKRGLNFSYSIRDMDGDQVVRLRVNVHLVAPLNPEYRWRGLAMSMRRIPNAPPNPVELNFPRPALLVVNDIVEREIVQGLVLIVGPTGAGKTHSMAAIIEQLNQRQPMHIITIEDPVEVVYEDKLSTIQQIEIGSCVEDYAEAGLSAKRQDPDIIAIGEIRDRQTAQAAVELALTGHLVLATMHSATTSYDALLKLNELTETPKLVSQSIQAIFAQRLIRGGHGKRRREGRVLVMEVARFGDLSPLKMLIADGLPDMQTYLATLLKMCSEGWAILLESDIAEKVCEGYVTPLQGFIAAEAKGYYLDALGKRLREKKERLQRSEDQTQQEIWRDIQNFLRKEKDIHQVVNSMGTVLAT
ncbi:MAG: ATPase, T2SS/T4P/T4SS family [Chloracidobacterium sp.]